MSALYIYIASAHGQNVVQYFCQFVNFKMSLTPTYGLIYERTNTCLIYIGSYI